jgi:hypothetical protein
MKIYKKDKKFWIMIIGTFVLVVLIWIPNFFKHCVWEWPIRWDIVTCAKEQWHPAVEEAVRGPS